MDQANGGLDLRFNHEVKQQQGAVWFNVNVFYSIES